MPSRPKIEETEFLQSVKRTHFANVDHIPLAWIFDTATLLVYELRKGKQLIGRESSSKKSDIGIRTADMEMSGAHCHIEIILMPNGYLEYRIFDNKSRNGVKINNQKALSADEVLLLKDGHTITLGHSHLQFVSIEKVKNKEQALQWFLQQRKRKA